MQWEDVSCRDMEVTARQRRQIEYKLHSLECNQEIEVLDMKYSNTTANGIEYV